MRNFATGLILVIAGLSSCKKEPPAPLPTANFFVSNNGCFSPCYLYFYDQSKNAVKWKWDFDNATYSNNPDDSSLYFNTGYYDVTLFVWNADDVKDSVIKTVLVY